MNRITTSVTNQTERYVKGTPNPHPLYCADCGRWIAPRGEYYRRVDKHASYPVVCRPELHGDMRDNSVDFARLSRE